MKKILIVSYFFPPSNFAGCYRVASWARHLHRFGYYPVIVTRCWNDNQSEVTDPVINNEFSHEKNDAYEVYRLPYHRNLRDKLHSTYGDNKYRLLRKFLTFSELFLQSYSNRIIPYSNLYDFSKELIEKEKDFACVILSGRPFQLFKFGYQLHRATGIKWIADYRDEWNTHQWILDGAFSKNMIRRIESDSEKKWLSNATLFTTCSESWVSSISEYIHRPGRVVLNGFEDSLFEMPAPKEANDTFTILNNGTLYSNQRIEIFLGGYKKFIDQNPGVKVHLLCPGIDYTPEEGERIRRNMKGYESYLKTSARIPKPQLIDMMLRTDLFLMVGTEGARGHHSSKIFEYLACRKPILLCPDDHDVMRELIAETRSGVILNSEKEVTDFLNKCYKDFLAGIPIPYQPNKEKIAFYSREKQAEVLAGILDEVTCK